MQPVDDYSSRVANEVDRYADVTVVHDLPGIFHYWSNTYVRPKLRALGFDSVTDLFVTPLRNLCRNYAAKQLRFLSIGAGNCDFEIDIAKALVASDHSNFTLDCLDINASMLERGANAAAQAGLSAHISPLQGDFNAWQPEREYDAVLASQALHHVVNLEGLFAQIKASLKSHGYFITSDMIGRNGHERWPEALEAVRHFWHRLPPSYRWNWQIHRYEEIFMDWNCAGDSFEGIRAQDILPLLFANFHFEKFAAFGNVIDPFTDRSFGPAFDPALDFDRAFIDEVHAFDEQSFREGALSPTHIFAVLSPHASTPTICADGLTPERALRREPLAPLDLPPFEQPVFSQHEQNLGRLLASIESERHKLEFQVQSYRQLNDELCARTQWARDLEHQLNERTAWAITLDKQVAEQTAWAQSLDKHNAQLTQRLIELETQLAHFQNSSLKARLKRLLTPVS
jgi:SAM-dependent methyltransferase